MSFNATMKKQWRESSIPAKRGDSNLVNCSNWIIFLNNNIHNNVFFASRQEKINQKIYVFYQICHVASAAETYRGGKLSKSRPTRFVSLLTLVDGHDIIILKRDGDKVSSQTMSRVEEAQGDSSLGEAEREQHSKKRTRDPSLEEAKQKQHSNKRARDSSSGSMEQRLNTNKPSAAPTSRPVNQMSKIHSHQQHEATSAMKYQPQPRREVLLQLKQLLDGLNTFV